MSSVELETRTRILVAAWQLMEQRRGQGVRMSDVAKSAGVSRQAVYLHFESRAELLVATARYVDEVRGLGERLRSYRAAASGVDKLETYVEFWGNYIPEVYGVAKALLCARETDEAAAAAWEDRMRAVHTSCRSIIEALERDGVLASGWAVEEATDLLWTILSIRNWEHLKIECDWTTDQYVSRMQQLLKHTFVQKQVDT